MSQQEAGVRKASVSRETLETQIAVELCLDGTGQCTLDTGLPFLEHMLDQIARHGQVDLDIKAKGDLHIDAHHTVEDIGITLGQAFSKAIGDKKGIVRYGHAYVPLDEALSRVVIDCSGRPGLEFHVPFTRAKVGEFDVDLVVEFFQGFVNHADVTLHIDNLRGHNAHHQAETVFKAFRPGVAHGGRARRGHGWHQPLDQRGFVSRDPRVAVIDYGMGNLHSVASALEHVGAAEVVVSHEPQAILDADRVVFPGVGVSVTVWKRSVASAVISCWIRC
jgi:imidazoleglycerol-phosphate dehydratase